MADATERDALEEGDERFSAASQWTLMRWKFGKHKLAMVSFFVIAAFYLVAVFCEFLAPNDIDIRFRNYVYAPPQRIRFVHEGRFSPRPFVYGLTRTIDSETLRRIYTPETSRPLFVHFFTRGAPYRFWGVAEGGTLFLLGTDQLGRDLYSRLLHGTRISLSIGLVGVAMSFVIGLVLGGLSGFYGGAVDIVIQRIIEILQSFPELYLLFALRAAFPPGLGSIQVHLLIIVILAFINWAGLARIIRGMVLSIKNEEFVLSARAMGLSDLKIVVRHILPNTMSFVIIQATVSIPGYILGESALSLLGLGISDPQSSWGLMLSAANDTRVVGSFPWLLAPGFMIFFAIMAWTFFGDGIRDAVDPRSKH